MRAFVDLAFGPFSNWIAACDRILALGATTLIPGHGRVTDAPAVPTVQRYLRPAHAKARARFDAGMDEDAAIDDIDVSDFADWNDPERIAANVISAYRELDPTLRPLSAPEVLMRMAAWRARH